MRLRAWSSNEEGDTNEGLLREAEEMIARYKEVVPDLAANPEMLHRGIADVLERFRRKCAERNYEKN